MLENFTLSPLSVFLLALIPGLVETFKRIKWLASGDRPLALSMGLGFVAIGFSEAIAAGLVPAPVLPWVRVVVLGLAGSLAVSGYYDLVKKFIGGNK